MFEELILVRHAQSLHHVGNLTGGWTDLSLTELGRAQAERTATRLAGELGGRECTLLSSDLRRAAESAAPIAAALNVQVVLHPELREIGNGKAAGLTRAEAKFIEQPKTQPIIDWVSYPEGESWRMMTQKVWGFLDAASLRINDRVIIVTHGNSGIAAVHWWLRLPEEYWSRCSFTLGTASISRFSVNRMSERTIDLLNDRGHLNGLIPAEE